MEYQQEDTRCQVGENLSKQEQWHHGLGVMPKVSMDTQITFSYSFIHNLSIFSIFLLLDDTYYLSKALFVIVSLPPRGIAEVCLLFCFSASGSRDLNQPVVAGSI